MKIFKNGQETHELAVTYLPVSKLSVVKDFKMNNDIVKIIYRII